MKETPEFKPVKLNEQPLNQFCSKMTLKNKQNKFRLHPSIGDFCELKVTALGPKGVGIDEFSYGYPILIPNAKLGEIVKAQIKLFYPLKRSKSLLALKNLLTRQEKGLTPINENQGLKTVLKGKGFKKAEAPKAFLFFKDKGTFNPINKSSLKKKYAVAQIASVLKTKKLPPSGVKTNLSVGDLLKVKLNSITIQGDKLCIGFANYEKFQLIIPLVSKNGLLNKDGQSDLQTVGQEIRIQITRMKLNYGFAKMLITPLIAPGDKENLSLLSQEKPEKGLLFTKAKGKQGNQMSKTSRLPLERKNLFINLIKGSKITLTLPKTATNYAKHIVILLSLPLISNNTKKVVFFIKNLLGAKLGSKVRVKFTKIGSTFAIGKIIRIAPNSVLKKLARARKNINDMLANGMHYGEKVVKCQARMRSFIWNLRKKGLLLSNKPNRNKKSIKGQTLMKGSPSPSPSPSPSSSPDNSIGLGQINLGSKALSLKTGLIGSKGLNPNTPLIKKGRHLINLLKTRRCLLISLNQLTKYAAKGRTFLFVGTTKPAADLIARAALFSLKTSFFVNTRWLGGMLTNWKTIKKSIEKIRPILKEKHKVITNILAKRAKIQNRLIKKVLSLRKKSKNLIKKGKQLIEKVKTFASKNSKKLGLPASKTNLPVFQGLANIKRKELNKRGQLLCLKRQSLLNKQNLLKEKTLNIKESGFLIAKKYKVLLNKLTATHKKLHDLRLLFILSKELRTISKLAKKQGKTQYTLSYAKAQTLNEFAKISSLAKITPKSGLVPNPPQAILNKVLNTINEIASLSLTDSSKSNSLMTKYSGSLNLINPLGGTGAGAEAGAEAEAGVKTLIGQIKENNSLKNQSGLNNLLTNKTLILTKLLSKFSRFLPYIKNAISSLLRLMLGIEKKMSELKTNLKNLKSQLMTFVAFNNKLNVELKIICENYSSEQQIVRVLRRKLKRHEAEKKLLKFLPKLRYLPTPKSQISLAIQILMKRLVDPKLKYPMDLIYDEKLRKKSKKVAAARKKKWQRLETYFGGLANMRKFKKAELSNNVAIIVGQQDEMNAVRECKKLSIKMFHIVDTNCNPGLADHFIPSNDDSRNSIKYLLTQMVTRIRLAHMLKKKLSS